MKRTTIRLDDGLLAEAKARAARSGRTLNAVLEDAIRASLDRPVRVEASPPDLPVCRGGRLLAGADLDDNAAVLELMEGQRVR